MAFLENSSQFCLILVSALVLIALISGYRGSLLIELTLPGGGARVHLDSTAKFQDAGETPASNTGLDSQALARSDPGGSPSLEL